MKQNFLKGAMHLMQKLLEKHYSAVRSVLVAVIIASIGLTAFAAPVDAVDLNNGNDFFQSTVKGTVTDEEGNPLPGVNIIVEGTVTGTVTNANGEYTIEVPAGANLVYSFVGMEKQTIPVDNKTTIDVVLKEVSTVFDDVVVVGYQEVERRDATASIVSVSSEEIENNAAPSFETLMQGRLAGVNIQNLTGEPGVKNVFVIRGNTNISPNLDGEVNSGQTGFSNPLYVVDGVPTTLEDLAGYDATNTNFLASLNTNDIESIDILKDASAAAIYGSRGANGVVIIKTKMGQVGPPRFKLNAYSGFSNTPNLIPVQTGVAERRAKMELIDQYWDYNRLKNNIPHLLTDSLNPAFNNNVNYQGLFYEPGFIQNYDFGVSGGNESTNYRVNIGYYDEDGIVVATGFQRLTLNLNLVAKLGDRLRNQAIVRVGYVDRKTGLGSTSPRWGTFPIDPIRMNSSLFYLKAEEEAALMGEYTQLRNKNINVNTQVSNTLRLELADGLHLNNMVAASLNTTKKDFFSPSILNSNRKTFSEVTATGNKNINIETYLSYIKDVGANHRFDALLGNSINYNQNESIQTGGLGAPSDQVQTISGIPQEDIWGSSNFSENGMLSYWSRLGYKFKDRYLLDLNFRADASSRFGANTRWGYFPATSIGWIFSEESFSPDWLNFGKLRASWGINGKQFSNDYLRFNSYNSGAAGFGNRGQRPVSTYNGVTTVTPNYGRIANRDLSWEQSMQWNIGMDLEMFNRRLYITPEVYNRETRDLLFDVNFPVETGYNSSQANIAGVRNYGAELSVTAFTFERSKDFQWEINFNIARNYNQLTALPNGNRDWRQGLRNLTVGLPMNQYFLLHTLGVIASQEDQNINPWTGEWVAVKYNYPKEMVGMYQWEDVNGDYEINKNPNDPATDYRTIPGLDPNAQYTGGLINTFSYKNWRMRVMSNFLVGRSIFNTPLVDRLFVFYYGSGKGSIPHMFGGRNIPVLQDGKLDGMTYWREPGDQTDLATLDPGGGNHLVFDSRQSQWLENGSFFKIHNIMLSYSFQKHQLEKIKLNRLRAYVMVDNVAYIQEYSGPDAEQVDVTGRDLSAGYRRPTKVTVGLNLDF